MISHPDVVQIQYLCPWFSRTERLARLHILDSRGSGTQHLLVTIKFPQTKLLDFLAKDVILNTFIIATQMVCPLHGGTVKWNFPAISTSTKQLTLEATFEPQQVDGTMPISKFVVFPIRVCDTNFLSYYVLYVETIFLFTHPKYFNSLYIDWTFVRTGYCNPGPGRRDLGNAKTLAECQSKCKDDCKYISYQDRGTACYGASSCDVTGSSYRTYARGVSVFI